MVTNPDQVRGHSQKLYKRRHKLEVRKNSFAFRVVDPWNSLPEEVISAPSIKSFERRLDKFWNNQTIKYDFNACLEILHKNNAPDQRAYSRNSEERNYDMVQFFTHSSST